MLLITTQTKWSCTDGAVHTNERQESHEGRVTWYPTSVSPCRPASVPQNLHWKLGQQTPSVGLFRDYGLNHIFFRNKTFLFFKIESWNFQHLFEKEFQLNQTTDKKNGNKNCLNDLNELKFCEFSRIFFSNRCWKFRISIWKNKTKILLKIYDLGHSL